MNAAAWSGRCPMTSDPGAAREAPYDAPMEGDWITCWRCGGEGGEEGDDAD